jgi:hypothetical protein
MEFRRFLHAIIFIAGADHPGRTQNHLSAVGL